MLVYMGVGRTFSSEATSGFFQTFFSGGGPKVVKFCFYHLKLRKQPFLLKFSHLYPPFDTHACVQENVHATPLNNWCISSVLTPSE